MNKRDQFGKKQGIWKEYNSFGDECIGHYIHGKREGVWIDKVLNPNIALNIKYFYHNDYWIKLLSVDANKQILIYADSTDNIHIEEYE